MSRAVEIVTRRAELLEKVVEVMLSEGVSELSLRPLAKAVGTSARLLIYHFGSKEALLAEALERVRQRIEGSLRSLAAKEDPRSLGEFLLMFWRWAVQEPNQRFFRLLFEIDALAMRNREKFPASFWGAGFARWRKVFETGFGQTSDKKSAATATFQLAALNGLLHDFLCTGDRKRTTNALHCLIESTSIKPTTPERRIRVRA